MKPMGYAVRVAKGTALLVLLGVMVYNAIDAGIETFSDRDRPTYSLKSAMRGLERTPWKPGPEVAPWIRYYGRRPAGKLMPEGVD